MTKKQHITARKPLSTSGARCGHRFGLCGSGRLPRRQKHGRRAACVPFFDFTPRADDTGVK